MDSRIFKIAITMVPQLGCRSCRQLIQLYPDPEELFNMSQSELKLIFGNHLDTIEAISHRTMFKRAQEELDFADRYNIQILFCTDKEFPGRLNSSCCSDTPVLLYKRGDCDLNANRQLSIVGSRRATTHGRETTRRIVEGLRDEEVSIVSGLAYGIDAEAHTAALECGLPTVAVLGHGLDQIYPPQNRNLAERIIHNGGCLLTEYPHLTRINAGHFPARNRIIAALGDGTVVVESAKHGGALITAAIANSYNREVMAVPGRPTDNYSVGCNNLLYDNRAAMVRNSDDILATLCWQKRGLPAESKQQELFAPQDATEKAVMEQLIANDGLTLDEIAEKCTLTLPKSAAIMLGMELRGLVKVLPGSRYQVI